MRANRTLRHSSFIIHHSSFRPRGVLLLLILALLAMFGLIAVAFVVLTGQAQRSAKSIERIDLTTDSPEKALEQAAMQVFRGSASPASAIGIHSLLEDIYGTNWYACRITGTPTAECGGQLIEFDYTVSSDATWDPTKSGGSWQADTDWQKRIGCVVTIYDGDAAGISTRIVGFNPTTNLPQMLAVDGLATASLSANTKFIINGMPFSGPGVGYNSTTHQLDLAYDSSAANPNTLTMTVSATTWPVALLPNVPFSAYTGAISLAGANEDYDAPDFQNMLLGAVLPAGGVLPSLHRPELINYWVDQVDTGTPKSWAGLWGISPDLCRKILLRPIGIMNGITTTEKPDHPNFTGSNPNFNPAWDGVTAGLGQWDVDNDGDGAPDSVWVDLGMPVRSTSDGRVYKPLFAILCLDLDGRLNVNANGCLAQQANATYTGAVSAPTTATVPTLVMDHVFAQGATGVASVALPRGVGYGPAEISLAPILTTDALYTQLLTDRYPSGGLGSDVGSHRLNLNKWFLYGDGSYADFSTAVNNAGAFGSPPDLAGTAAIGVDYGGRPVYAYAGTDPTMGQDIDTVRCPYELDLSAKRLRGAADGTAGNVPYSAAELERILRPYDRDATTLPARLAQATATTGDAKDSVLIANRNAVTTDSWDVPVPSAALAKEILSGTNALPAAMQPFFPPHHVTDVLKLLLLKKTSTLTDTELNTLLSELFPPELLAGRKMDLNRAFGDGKNNNTDNVVDEPGEVNNALNLYTSTASTGQPVMGFTASNDPEAIATTSLKARQLYARYIYVLAMLLADRQQLDAMSGSPQNTARILAQWAVNVVDFYDRDSIMTPFEFDPNPFTAAGWRADDNLMTDDVAQGIATPHLVWGCERPELLISETLAFHDRRTEDLNTEVVNNGEAGNAARTGPGLTAATEPADTIDVSFDQKFRPQGSLFIELYNPWTDQEPRPVELCNSVNGGVNLKKITPTGNSPVWRLAIVDGPADAGHDPDSDDPAISPLPKIERTVYFAGPTAAPTLPTDCTHHYQPSDTLAGKIATILPGRYAVIGPGESTDTGKSITYLGFKGQTPQSVTTANTRRIELDLDAATDQVQVFNQGGTTNPLTGLSINEPTAVIINTPCRLSISEPDPAAPSAYPVNGPDSQPYAAGGYQKAFDIPLDQDPLKSTVSAAMKAAIADNARTDSVKVVHLQRLANPLIAYQPDPAQANYNPYRTIDSMPIDLTAFNGITTATDPQTTNKTMDAVEFWSRQRGQNNNSTANKFNLWRQEPLSGMFPKENKNSVPATPAGFTFNARLSQTLGYLSDDFGLPSTVTGAIGDPRSPFQWLTWNNRPFVSQMELLQVPWLKSSMLCMIVNPSLGNPYQSVIAPYSHLLSFLSSDASNTTTSTQLHRILEFVGVPSRFVGTEVQVNPTTADGIFHTPFNRIPTLREPGKINLNTISSEDVYNGLLNGCAGLSWTDFQRSREGNYATTPNDYPTRFANPFRSFSGANLVPLPAMTTAIGPEVNATLLREGANTVTSPTGQPLFRFTQGGDYNDTTRNPYFYYHGMQRLANLTTTRSNVYAVWITVGYFEVEPAATTHPDSGSWDQAKRNIVFPDGFTLGRELGSDTGEIERHRGFYIFDRSLPVGFQRGQDLNVDKAILVNRFVE